MALDRREGRNVHLYHNDERHNPQKQPVGGLVLTRGITKGNFYSMTDILFDGVYYLQDEERTELDSNSEPLLPGNYYVSGHFNVTTETYSSRPYSSSSSQSIRSKDFTHDVRSRDGGCVITGREATMAHRNKWTGFQAAHIFPRALRSSWNTYNFGIEGIDSVQNGLLLDAVIYQHFDAFDFSVDTKDNYKVVSFQVDADAVIGTRYLGQQFLDHPERPPDKLFEWHFKQAVLANMKGFGGPVFDHDFPPGSDMLGAIRDGPNAAERMEMELFDRLADHNSIVV